MSDAIKILDERLARGEINQEEYHRLVNTINSGSGNSGTKAQPASGSNWVGNIFGVLIALGIFVMIAIYYAEQDREGLESGNFQTLGNNRFSMVLANQSKKADVAIIKIVQNDIDKCLFKTRLGISESVKVTFRCAALSAGEMHWQVYWGSKRPKYMRLATTID